MTSLCEHGEHDIHDTTNRHDNMQTCLKTHLHRASMMILSVSINAYQLWLQPIFGQLTWFIKKSKQFYQRDIASNIAALALPLSVNRPYTVIGETSLHDLVRS